MQPRRILAGDIPHIRLPDAAPPKERFLSLAEADALYAACRREGVRPLWDTPYTRIEAFCRIGLNTAARKSVIEQLTVFQVDLKSRQIDFNTKGRRQTKKRRPIVPISDELLPVLTALRAEAIRNNSEYILGEQGGSIKTAFRRAVASAGLQGVTPHTLRHTWATWAAMYSKSGLWETMYGIAGVMGDTVQTVFSVYAKYHPEYLRDAVNFRRGVEAEKRAID